MKNIITAVLMLLPLLGQAQTRPSAIRGSGSSGAKVTVFRFSSPIHYGIFSKVPKGTVQIDISMGLLAVKAYMPESCCCEENSNAQLIAHTNEWCMDQAGAVACIAAIRDSGVDPSALSAEEKDALAYVVRRCQNWSQFIDNAYANRLLNQLR